jgi:hypothetical protein|tara:strand:+ start:4063 stop:4614 length:552 start_codon:yes stop_codon:yes gene_type:complete
MNNSVIGLSLGAAWCVVKYISFLVNPMHTSIVPTVLLNILFLLSAIAIALYITKRNQTEKDSFLGDIKNGLKAGLPYTILVAVFLFFYYSTINPGFNERQIAHTNAKFDLIFDDPKEYQELKNSNPSFEVMSKEELREEMRKGPKSFYTPGATMTLSLLAMLLLSTLYSILVASIYRKIVFRE